MNLFMKSTKAIINSARAFARWPAVALAIFMATVALTFAADTNAPATAIGKTFSSPEDAVAALGAAAAAKDRSSLREIFGPASDDIQLSDRVEADQELSNFSAAFTDAHKIVREANASLTLEIGTNDWPFPVPLVQQDGKWHFDTEAGKEEILDRRIGRNELSALKTVRAYVDAQREYASKDRTGNEVLKYAQHFLSAPGKKDGLFWPPELDGELSPLGPEVAVAESEGYELSDGEQSGPKPFHGYYYQILTRQGSHAPGGKYNYIINGNMIGGFALIAWPADYDNSGVMTFIVNQQGKVYQKDLGEKTDSLARAVKEYDPDETWTVSPD
jgi:hypothetical protein